MCFRSRRLNTTRRQVLVSTLLNHRLVFRPNTRRPQQISLGSVVVSNSRLVTLLDISYLLLKKKSVKYQCFPVFSGLIYFLLLRCDDFLGEMC